MDVTARSTRLTAALAAALLAAALPAAGAMADPAVPSQDQVRQAQGAASAKASEVDRVSAELAAAQARADAASVALSQAAEEFDQARLELATRTQDAALAAGAAAGARAGLASARREVGQIASRQYRQGAVSTLGLLLDAEGPQAVLERAALLQAVGDTSRHAMNRMSARRLVADLMDTRAREALAAQRAAAERLAVARDRAERQARQAREVAAQVEAQRASLAVQLVALQATSTQLAQDRRAGLEAERLAREAAARTARVEAGKRARAEEADRAARAGRGGSHAPGGSASSGSSGGSGSSSGGSSRGGSSGGSSAPPVSTGSTRGSGAAGAAAVAWAKGRVGLPYQWGGAGPDSYDCSGLTMRAWQNAGVSLPHSSRAQYQVARKVSYAQMRAGDLIFWATNTADARTIHHVALYAGAGLMVEAPATGLNVRVTSVRWSGAMPFAGRP